MDAASLSIQRVDLASRCHRGTAGDTTAALAGYAPPKGSAAAAAGCGESAHLRGET
jgi:hypothetical protein